MHAVNSRASGHAVSQFTTTYVNESAANTKGSAANKIVILRPNTNQVIVMS